MGDTQLWKQAAAAESVDDAAVEKAFMDISYGQVSNHARPLMTAPHLIGFETVQKNEKATKMFGVYAVRAGSQLFYIPVFFLNGVVKGGDMIWNQKEKTFCYLDPQRAQQIIDQNMGDADHVEKAEDFYKNQEHGNHLERLVYPQDNLSKVASWEEDVSELQQSLVNLAATDSSELGMFLAATGEEGQKKFASAMEDAKGAMELVLYNYTQDELMGATVPEERLVKSAVEESTKNDGTGKLDAKQEKNFLKVYDAVGDLPRDDAKTVDRFFERGYAVLDKRLEGQVAVVVDEYPDKDITTINEPCTAEALTEKGEFVKVFLLSRSYDIRDRCDMAGRVASGLTGFPGVTDYGNSSYDEPISMHCDVDFLVVETASDGGKHKAADCRGRLVGREQIRDLDEVDKALIKFTDVKKDQVYVIVDREKKFCSRPFRAAKIEKKDDGVLWIETADDYGWCCSGRGIVYSPNAANSMPKDARYTDDYGLLPLAFENIKHKNENSEDCDKFNIKWDQDLLSKETLDDFIRKSSSEGLTEEVVIRRSNDDFMIKAAGHTSPWMDRDCAEAALTSIVGLRYENACDVIADVGTHKDRVLTVGYPPEMQKRAFSALTREPNFTRYYDDDHGVPVENPQIEDILTQTPQDPPPPTRLGEHAPGMGGDSEGADNFGEIAIMTSTPDQLAQLSQQLGSRKVFDHGMLGSFAKDSYDAIAMTDKMIPELKQAATTFGQILFLIRWRPTEFEDAFGDDEIDDLERKILSQFRGISETLLQFETRGRDVSEMSIQQL